MRNYSRHLKEVVKIINGGTPKTKIPDYWDGKLLWITPKDLGKLDSVYVSDTFRKITELGLKKSSAKLIKPNSIILSTRAPIGHLAINTKEITTNQGCRGIEPNEELNTKYLFYFLKSSVVLLNDLGKGTTFKELSTKSLGSIKIPVPPLPEQQQIVQILDQAFEKIDRAIANIEQNIKNAEELFQAKLNEVFSQKGEGWEEKKLSEITSKIGSGATPRGGQASYKESGISLIRSMNVYDEGFRDKKLAFIDEEQARKLDNVTVCENDILLNITGASVARCCRVNKNYIPARVNQHVSIIRLEKNIMSSSFLHYTLTSKKMKDLLLGIGEQGATRQAITKAQIENFVVRFPSDIEEQNKLVNSINEIKKQTVSVKSGYKKKVVLLQELKNSLLEKAFKGELTKEEVIL